jgi:hypothetical protein
VGGTERASSSASSSSSRFASFLHCSSATPPPPPLAAVASGWVLGVAAFKRVDDPLYAGPGCTSCFLCLSRLFHCVPWLATVWSCRIASAASARAVICSSAVAASVARSLAAACLACILTRFSSATMSCSRMRPHSCVLSLTRSLMRSRLVLCDCACCETKTSVAVSVHGTYVCFYCLCRCVRCQ